MGDYGSKYVRVDKICLGQLSIIDDCHLLNFFQLFKDLRDPLLCPNICLKPNYFETYTLSGVGMDA